MATTDTLQPAPVPGPVGRFGALLAAADRAVYAAERVLAGGLFLAMVLVMALSVIHRVFSREEGRLSTALLHIGRAMGHDLDPAFAHGSLSMGVQWVLAFLVALLAVRTRLAVKPPADATTQHADPPAPPWPRSLGLAVLVAAGLAASVWAVLALFPNGLVWGPAVALACMLWVGFLGASLATRDKKHLALEMGEKLWPARVLPYSKAVAALLTGLLCGFLSWLAWLSLQGHLTTWQVNPLAGQLLPTEIPKWAVFTILPYTFGIMALRFAIPGLAVLLRLQPAPLTDTGAA